MRPTRPVRSVISLRIPLTSDRASLTSDRRDSIFAPIRSWAFWESSFILCSILSSSNYPMPIIATMVPKLDMTKPMIVPVSIGYLRSCLLHNFYTVKVRLKGTPCQVML